MQKHTDEIFEQFQEAIAALQNASPRNNAKGNALKEWANANFHESLRVSIVNEAKQSGNRAKEQLSQRAAEHALFIVTDEDALEPLVRHCKQLAYPELKTLFFASAGSVPGQIIPRLLIRNDLRSSSLEQFYASVYPNIKVGTFSPKAETATALRVRENSPRYSADANDASLTVNSTLSDDDAVLSSVLNLISDGYAGVIFTGPPGTSKSWYAREVALSIVSGRIANVFFIQFHPGYQYEDFMEAYAPNASGGFELTEKLFLKACKVATEKPDESFVVIIDELSRTDVVRVFGEALTYIERDNRGVEFTLVSGRNFRIPSNLILLCTMNPWDRGADELDIALERRFAKIYFGPSLERLRSGLESSELPHHRRQRLEQFFSMLIHHPNKLCRLGHAYFVRARTDEALQRLWDHQLLFHFQRVLRNDEEQLNTIQSAWNRIFEE